MIAHPNCQCVECRLARLEEQVRWLQSHSYPYYGGSSWHFYQPHIFSGDDVGNVTLTYGTTSCSNTDSSTAHTLCNEQTSCGCRGNVSTYRGGYHRPFIGHVEKDGCCDHCPIDDDGDCMEHD